MIKLRYVIRDGEKVLQQQELVDVLDEHDYLAKIEWKWIDVPIEEEGA